MKKIIFFDINGTLIERDSRTDLPFLLAVDEVLKLKNAMEGVDTAARSDHDVFHEVLERHEINYSEELWKELLKVYKEQLEKHKSLNIWRLNVDALSFVERLAQSGDYILSLITGELSIGAEYKLKHVGLWDFFNTGGFGEDGLKRFDIADAALKKAESYYQCSFSEKWVIGDTMLDIETARHLNAKIIAIATGAHTADQLEALQPDYLIKAYHQLPEKTFF